MSARRIRADFEGVVHVPNQLGVTLKAGDEEPEGVTLGDHLFDADQESSSVDDKGWSSKTKDELKAEIDSRNADREDDAKITPDGPNKPELIKALDADDAKAAGAAA